MSQPPVARRCERYGAACDHRPDIILLAVCMPDADGLSRLPSLVEVTDVMIAACNDDADVVRAALVEGTSGYLVPGNSPSMNSSGPSAAKTGEPASGPVEAQWR
ncbi:hypothetical protein AB0H73_09835 [Streptomyces olivoreticuli]